MPVQANRIADIDGNNAVTKILTTLLNSFPGLGNDREIGFSNLTEDASGIAYYPTSGAVLLSNKESVTGKVKQRCAYPFFVVYRAAPKTEKQKTAIKEFLDGLGRWLERQPVMIDGSSYALSEFPAISAGRTIKSINRTNPAHVQGVFENGYEDWVIGLSLIYENIFYK